MTVMVSGKQLSKRILPNNENCNPGFGNCRKGDWISKSIADCNRNTIVRTCRAEFRSSFSWTVEPSVDCEPVQGLGFNCGATGSNTRCVCSDTKGFPNQCRCQYWTDENPGASHAAFCTGYYVGGISGVHHWACCDNCDDTTNDCNEVTWQGGSSESYCSTCGQKKPNVGGIEKYYFNCGSCAEQRECSNGCNSNNVRGLCWRWLDCFKGCCFAKAEQPTKKRQIGSLNFCGDGTCGGNESAETCPMDCCYRLNSMCSPENNAELCDAKYECCGDSSCCLQENAAVTTCGYYSGAVAVVSALILFL